MCKYIAVRCINESVRKSVSFHSSNAQEARRVFSPEQNCPRQPNCVQVVYTGKDQAGGLACMSLDGYKESQSFRFVGGAQCDALIIPLARVLIYCR
jgi:hypothetical protein